MADAAHIPIWQLIRSAGNVALTSDVLQEPTKGVHPNGPEGDCVGLWITNYVNISKRQKSEKN
jgi:hypothetical protein